MAKTTVSFLLTVDAWYVSVSLAFSNAKCMRQRISPSVCELMHAGVGVCVRGRVHELAASVRQEAALH